MHLQWVVLVEREAAMALPAAPSLALPVARLPGEAARRRAAAAVLSGRNWRA